MTLSPLYFKLNPETSSKPDKSEYDLKNVDIIEKLDCQTVKANYKAAKCIELPDNFPVKNELYLCESEPKKHKNKEFIINIIKSNFTRINMNVSTWAVMRSLMNEKPFMQVGFLPFVPAPVTDYATVHTAMKNFLNVVNQLKQQTLPLFCDERVFRTVIHIYLNHNEEFQNLLPMLEAFHMAKIAQHSAGKYIRDSGFEDALIETKTFGIKVVQSVFDGTHYIRSLRGLLIISEAIHSLQWEAFWLRHSKDKFKDELNYLQQLYQSFINKDIDVANLFNEAFLNIATLKEEFDKFLQNVNKNSEFCRYLNGISKIVSIIKHLVPSDREGNWHGHLQAVQDLLPIFREADCIDYLRYASCYLEKMRMLPTEHPEIYELFFSGHFVVKTNTGYLMGSRQI